MKFVALCIALMCAVSCSVADAGLFFGPNVRIVERHYHAPAAVVAVPAPAVVQYRSVIVSADAAVGAAHPHKHRHHKRKAAQHTAQAAKHGVMADHYLDN